MEVPYANLNRIYQELMCEGYTDLIGSGIAAIQHLADWIQGKQVGKVADNMGYSEDHG